MGSKYPQDPDILMAALELCGLHISGAWLSCFFTVNGGREQTLQSFRQAIPFYQTLGIHDIYAAEIGYSVHLQPIPALANKPEFDSRQWDWLVAGLHEVGRVADDNGLRIIYHHHTGTGVQTEADVDRLMAATDPKLLWLLLDTAHITVGGGNALSLTEKYADRICHVHLKQVRAPVLDQMRSGTARRYRA